jgi:hypothetical protein
VDNAAALLALQLHDQFYDSELLPAAADDWDNYIAKELRFDGARFPCAGFTTTNRCRLVPVGTSFAWLNIYTTRVGRESARYYWRDFRHYYKESFGFLAAWITEVPEDGVMPEFCDFSVQPLHCGKFATAFGMQAAAQRGDWLSYYQLNNTSLLKDLVNPPNRLWSQRPQDQVDGMIKLAARLIAVTARN